MRRIFSKAFSLAAPLVGFSILLSPALSLSADLPTILGQQEYKANCASCHGAEGKGDGPMADQLTSKPADLQMISKNHNGIFPTSKVYKIIDGRQTVRAHGTSDMPVWGVAYSTSVATTGGSKGPDATQMEAAIAGRILSLVYFLESIQTE